MKKRSKWGSPRATYHYAGSGAAAWLLAIALVLIILVAWAPQLVQFTNNW